MSDIKAIVGSRVYKIGDLGPAVSSIQLRLRDLGYGLRGTGYFGPATDTAVSAFQKRAAISPADGRVGAETAAALDAGIPIALVNISARLVGAEITRPLWLEAGIKLIGTKEFAGAADNPVLIDWAKDEGGVIVKSYTHDSIPWCALFANHILTKVGLKGTETLWALDFEGKWPSVKLEGPAVGAFAPMLRNGGGHIVCIVGRTAGGNFMGLGGNQRDAVNIAEFPRSRLDRGFWWPKDVSAPKRVGFDSLPVVRTDGRVSTAES